LRLKDQRSRSLGTKM